MNTIQHKLQQIKESAPEYLCKLGIETLVSFTEGVNATERFYRASPEESGAQLQAYAKGAAALLVLILVYALDLATLMYRAGYALGTWTHSLNNAITNAVVRKSTQSFSKIQEETSKAWKLQLPLPQSLSALLSVTSQDTTPTSSGKTSNQPPSSTMTPGPNTEGQRKEVGTTKQEPLSKPSASSQRSKQSAKPSSCTRSVSSSTKPKSTTSDGLTSESSSTTSTAKRTQRRGRTTAKPPLK